MTTMDTKKKETEWVLQEGRLKYIALLLAGGAVIVVLLQGLLYFISPLQNKVGNQSSKETATQEQIDPFAGVSLEARAVYVLDLKTNTVLFEKNSQEKLPLASITKTMTALLARENISQNAVITLSKDDLATEGDSGLRTGERWRVGDLLNVMLIISSNDAAHAIAGFVGGGSQNIERGTPEARAQFIAMMNEKAHTLGFPQMEYFNESGLDIIDVKNGAPARSGGYGSAHDVALLFAELWKKYPETVEITTHKAARIVSQSDIVHVLPNTNEITGQIPGLIASKTGYTTLAGGNLVVIFDHGIGDPVVAVVLGSTYKGRFDDMQKIVGAVRTLEL